MYSVYYKLLNGCVFHSGVFHVDFNEIKKKLKIVFYQVIIWLDPEQLAEVAESQWCVRLETEVWIMMCWSQVASLTAKVKAFPLGITINKAYM